MITCSSLSIFLMLCVVRPRNSQFQDIEMDKLDHFIPNLAPSNPYHSSLSIPIFWDLEFWGPTLLLTDPGLRRLSATHKKWHVWLVLDFLLIGGGVGNVGLTAGTELIDSEGNPIFTLASNHLKRESPMAVTLNDGTPLVCGEYLVILNRSCSFKCNSFHHYIFLRGKRGSTHSCTSE